VPFEWVLSKPKSIFSVVNCISDGLVVASISINCDGALINSTKYSAFLNPSPSFVILNAIYT
jgi:hypothetical protein